MCFSHSNSDTYQQNQNALMAQSIAAQNAIAASNQHHQDLITQGQEGIDQAFTQFDPNYYDHYRTAYTGYYTPQVADQYGRARDQLVSALADRGTLESSVGAQSLADLDKRNTDQIAQIQSGAADAVNAKKASVDAAKTSLYNVNTSVADPTQISTQANANASTLVAPNSYTPLGNVFTDLVNPIANYTRAASGSPYGYVNPFSATPQNTGPYGSGSSVRVG
jgi:hypothetical protein